MTVCPSLIEHRDLRPRPVYITVRNPLDPIEYAQLRLDPPHPRSHPTWSDVCRGPRFLPSGVHLELLVAESLSNTGLFGQNDQTHFHGADAPASRNNDLAVSEGGSAFWSKNPADRGQAGEVNLREFADQAMREWKALPHGEPRVRLPSPRRGNHW